MKLQRTFILTLVCLFTLGLGIVSATEPEKIYPSPVRDVMATTGEIIAVDGDKVTVKGDGNYPVATVIVTVSICMLKKLLQVKTENLCVCLIQTAISS